MKPFLAQRNLGILIDYVHIIATNEIFDLLKVGTDRHE